MSESIAKCPWCGGEAFVFGRELEYSAACTKCHVRAPVKETIDDAIAAWNGLCERLAAADKLAEVAYKSGVLVSTGELEAALAAYRAASKGVTNGA